MYLTLNPALIIKTLDALHERIAQRFPAAGLTGVCGDLCAVARKSHARAEAIARPAYLLRTVTLLLILIGLGTLLYIGRLLVATQQTSSDLFSTIQAVDATFNIAILTGAAIFFLVSLEERIKRRRALLALGELRSIVHVIDMHQLTKDPVMLSGPRTAASPERHMTPFELTRYLDYCSEMLSLTAKIAALYAQSSNDAIVIDAVSDLTTLTTNLSSKIWQKITLVQTIERPGQGALS